MTKHGLYETHKRFSAVPKASTASGDVYLIVDYPGCEAHIGVWSIDIDNILSEQLPVRIGYRNTATANQEEEESFKIDWSESEAPLTQMDLLESNDKKIQDLICQIRTSIFIPYREKLANRLFTLFNDAKEEDPTSLGIVFGSLNDFYNFLQLNIDLKYPTITLTPDDNIYASWRSKQNQVFSVHFLSNKDVSFVIFKPNKKDPKRKFRFYGIATTDTLLDEIPNGLLDWITE